MNGQTHHYGWPGQDAMLPETVATPDGQPKEHLSDRNDESAQDRPDPRVQQMRTLSTFDVAALIANKMIGTGIFTGPTAVLRYTLNKNVAIGLWTLGFVYTVLSMLLYTEYARKLPFTGGELVYLDDALPKPRLLAYTLYAFYFVFLYTSCTNCLQFARFVLAATNTDYFDFDDLDDDQSLVRGLAVVAISAVCMLLYVSSSKSKVINKATAAAKILLLLGMIFAGIVYVSKEHSQRESSRGWNETMTGTTSWPLALITVLFSFHGWENATMVAGEIDSFKVLRRGFLLAVFGVGALYLSIAILLCAAFEWAEGLEVAISVPGDPLTLYLGATTSDKGSAGVAAAILISLSAFGSLLSVAYTCVRVKQSIGWANILPFSFLWRKQGPVHPEYDWKHKADGSRELVLTFSERAFNHPGTPEGGIVLHWTMTVLYITVTAAYEHIQDAITFSGNILVFGHFFAQTAVALLFIPFGSFGFQYSDVLYYPAWRWHATQNNDALAGNPPKWMRPKFAPWIGPLIISTMVFGFSAVIIVAACLEARGRILLYVMISILATGLIYWFVFVRLPSARKVYSFFGFSMEEKVHGVDDTDDPTRVCDWCSVLKQAHRHPAESYQSFNVIALESNSLVSRALAALFSGSSEQRLSAICRDMWQAVFCCFGTRDNDSEMIRLQRRRD